MSRPGGGIVHDSVRRAAFLVLCVEEEEKFLTKSACDCNC